MPVHIPEYEVYVSDEVVELVRSGGGSRDLISQDTGLGSHRAAKVLALLRDEPGPVQGGPISSVPVQEGPEEEDPEEEDPYADDEAVGGGEYNALKWVQDHDYLYDDEVDEYEVYLNAAKSKLTIPGAAIRDLREWYCGEKLTQNQCAQRLGMQRSWLRELLHTFGITKDDLPLTDEEVKDGTVENLSVRALQAKKRVVAKKIEDRERREEARDALRWRTWELEHKRAAEGFLETLEGRVGLASSYSVPLLVQSAEKPSRGLVCNHQDLHLGVRPVGSDVTLEEQVERRLAAYRTILEKAGRAYRIDRVVLNMLPDAGHTDGKGSTTSGTQVEANASDGEIGRAVMDLGWDMVNLGRQYAPVDFVLDRGNHNAHSAMLGGHAIYRHFRDEPDVSFVRPRGPLCLTTYGDHLLVFLHGDVPKKRLEKIGNVLLAYARDLLGVTRYITVHTGHLHFEAVFDDGGLVRRQAPAVPETDAYHSDNLFVGARKLMQGVLLNPNGYDDDTVTASLEPRLLLAA